MALITFEKCSILSNDKLVSCSFALIFLWRMGDNLKVNNAIKDTQKKIIKIEYIFVVSIFISKKLVVFYLVGGFQLKKMISVEPIQKGLNIFNISYLVK